jgi:sterol desaturase/sphingolipid hydroxylase (fatty acid hydroxylase superfamily)
MSDKASGSEEAFLNRQRARVLKLDTEAASTSGVEEVAEGARRRRGVSAGGTKQQLPMSNGKIGYYADFILYAAILLALVSLTLRGSRSAQLIGLGAAIVAAGSWTLVEYLLHRFVFHRIPLIADLHHAHHAAPRAYLGTPTWVSFLILSGLFLAIWRLSTLNIAFGAISGLITGWLWYGLVHHVIHYRRPRRLAVALRGSSHRHLLHHSLHGAGNYGVTTPVWDYVFGTKMSPRARAMKIAVPRAEQDS